MGAWTVITDDAVGDWLTDLSRTDLATFEQVTAAIDKLEDDGPMLGRPLVDRIEGSRFQNMKELRPGSSGASEIRILFAFDALRRAVLLVGGDKAGQWQRWYMQNIPIADGRFEEHQALIKGKGGG